VRISLDISGLTVALFFAYWGTQEAKAEAAG